MDLCGLTAWGLIGRVEMKVEIFKLEKKKCLLSELGKLTTFTHLAKLCLHYMKLKLMVLSDFLPQTNFTSLRRFELLSVPDKFMARY